MSSGQVAIYRGTRALLSSYFAKDGSYSVVDIPPGDYSILLGTNGDRFGQVYPHVDSYDDCVALAQSEKVTVSLGQTLADIDLDPIGMDVVLGRVTDAQNGQGIGGVVLDLWNIDDLSHTGSVSTRPDGCYLLRRDNSYYGQSNVTVSTDAGNGYTDEVYDNHLCPLGAAYYGQCSLTGAQAFALPSVVMQPSTVNFSLNRNGGEEIFLGNFE